MDIEKSRVVVCSANYAWYYDTASDCDRLTQDSEARGDEREGGRYVYPGSSNTPIRGFRLPSSRVVEARFSGNATKCFFGTKAGQVYMVSEKSRFYRIRHLTLSMVCIEMLSFIIRQPQQVACHTGRVGKLYVVATVPCR